MITVISLATHCLICGRALTDPDSVTRGIGPECSREGYPTDGPAKDEANSLIHAASIAATEGNIQVVIDNSAKVAALGYPVVAEKMMERFVNAAKNAKVEILEEKDLLYIDTPFRRGEKTAFIQAWRAIPGRTFGRKGHKSYNVVPVKSKAELWKLLKKFFPGMYGTGPKGLFRIPKEENNG
jgi:hypothetical protein